MKDISVIIVNYNTNLLCKQAVESALTSAAPLDIEVVIVDNSSNSDEKYCSTRDEVIVLPDVENKGFGNACNIGAEKAESEVLLFLNPDTILNGKALFMAFEYFKSHPNVGTLGIRTVLENNSLDHGCKRGFPTPMRALSYFLKLDRIFPQNRTFGGYRMTYLPEDKTAEVDAVSGAFLMVSKRVFDELGGFDEDYFMYGEDIDLCYRIKKKGYSIIYYADAVMTHLKGRSGLYSRNPQTVYHFYNAMIIFYNKHYRDKYNLLVTYLVRFTISAKRDLAIRKAKRWLKSS